MNLILPNYPLVAGVISLDQINENFNAIQQHEITDADISSSAALTVTKLAAYYVETFVQLIYHFNLQGADAAGWPAAAATPLDAVPMPGQSGDAAWTATDVTYVCSDVGSADGAFGVSYGSYDGSGAWVAAGNVLASQTIASPGADGTGSQGRSSRLSVTIPNGSTVTSLALFCATQGTGLVSAASFLKVTVRLRRALMNF